MRRTKAIQREIELERPKLAMVRTQFIAWENNLFSHSTLFDIRFVSKPKHIRGTEGYRVTMRDSLPFSRHVPFMSSYHFLIAEGLEETLKSVDIINSAELFTFLSGQCAKLATKLSAKLAVTVWQTISHHIFYNFVPPYSMNTHFVLKHADMYLALTKKAIQYLQSLSAPREKIRLVYPGVDLQQFTPAKKREHENIRILFVGRLVSNKGVIFLLRAFSLLCKVLPNVELWIIGRGELLPFVMKYAQKYPIKYLGGWLSPHELIQAYQQSDVFCLPSCDYKVAGVKVWEEQFGMVLVEAMACGLPIVTTHCGAIPEVVGHQNLIVPQRSIKDLYLALRRIIEEGDEYRRFLGEANRERAEKLFDIQKQGMKLDRCLSELLQN